MNLSQENSLNVMYQGMTGLIGQMISSFSLATIQNKN